MTILQAGQFKELEMSSVSTIHACAPLQVRVSPGHKPGLKLLPYMIAIENEEHILFIFVPQYVAQCHLNK